MAREVAEHNLAVLEGHGIDTVITSCAECLGAFRDFYPRLSKLKFRVMHITEVVQQLIAEGRLTLHNRRKGALRITIPAFWAVYQSHTFLGTEKSKHLAATNLPSNGAAAHKAFTTRPAKS